MFTHSQLKELYETRRKGAFDKPMRLTNCRCKMDGDGDMQVHFHGNLIGWVTPDDVWQVQHCGYEDSPTTRDRIYQISKVGLWRERRITGLDNTLRCNGDLPFSSNLKWRDGVCINPHEAANDEITTVTRSAVATVTRKLRTLKALMHTMARCGMFDESKAPAWPRMQIPSDEALAEPTAELASSLYLRFMNDHGYNVHPSKLLDTGFAALRRTMYEDNPCNFDVKVISHGNDQQLAA